MDNIKIIEPGVGQPDDAFRIRREVFIDEQKVSEAEEYDGRDTEACHAVLYADGEPAACARMLEYADGYMKLGRVAVLKSRRGGGFGAAVCRSLIERAREAGKRGVVVEAQLHAIGFYNTLGFVEHGGIFLDAGIEHKKMTLDF